MKTENKILTKGELLYNGDVIAKDCKISMDGISPVVTYNFNSNQMIGELKSCKEIDGTLICEYEITRPTILIKLKWYQKFLNNLVSIVGFGKIFKDEEDIIEKIKNYTEPNIGFRVKERDGNLIKDIDLFEVSLTAKK